jgi:hypothetical protein
VHPPGAAQRQVVGEKGVLKNPATRRGSERQWQGCAASGRSEDAVAIYVCAVRQARCPDDHNNSDFRRNSVSHGLPNSRDFWILAIRSVASTSI